MSFQILPETSSSGDWQVAKKPCVWFEFNTDAPCKAHFRCSRLCFQILPDTSGFGNSERSCFGTSLPIVDDRLAQVRSQRRSLKRFLATLRAYLSQAVMSNPQKSF
jgi:hypothetical protein